MIIIREKKELSEGKNPAIVRISQTGDKLKATIEIDCKAALEGIDPYRVKRYSIQKATPEHVAKVFQKYLKEIEYIAIDDDSELVQKVADLL